MLCAFHRLLLAVLAASTAAAASAQPRPADPCNIQTSERVVAVGDVHGAHDAFLRILRAAGLVDARGRWSGGRAVLVQTGDLLDRGTDSRKVLDLLRRLERDAARAGGAVHALLGNHEVMRLVRDWRYVSAGEYAAFATSGSASLRERVAAAVEPDAARRAVLIKDVPLGMVEMQRAFLPDGEYGRWLRERPVTVKINGVMYVHGGISPQAAPLGCAGINAAVKKEIAGPPPQPAEAAALFASSETGPLWYRGLAEESEANFAPTLTGVLEQVAARAIVIGHTVADGRRIRTRFDGRVVLIDTGMLGGTTYPGGGPSALEMHGGAAAAVYPDRREPITVAR
jgi:hypothetical protein